MEEAWLTSYRSNVGFRPSRTLTCAHASSLSFPFFSCARGTKRKKERKRERDTTHRAHISFSFSFSFLLGFRPHKEKENERKKKWIRALVSLPRFSFLFSSERASCPGSEKRKKKGRGRLDTQAQSHFSFLFLGSRLEMKTGLPQEREKGSVGLVSSSTGLLFPFSFPKP